MATCIRQLSDSGMFTLRIFVPSFAGGAGTLVVGPALRRRFDFAFETVFPGIAMSRYHTLFYYSNPLASALTFVS